MHLELHEGNVHHPLEDLGIQDDEVQGLLDFDEDLDVSYFRIVVKVVNIRQVDKASYDKHSDDLENNDQKIVDNGDPVAADVVAQEQVEDPEHHKQEQQNRISDDEARHPGNVNVSKTLNITDVFMAIHWKFVGEVDQTYWYWAVYGIH